MRGVGVTADTGFLIGLERNKDRALGVLARLGKQRVSVPVAIVAEWWRGSARQVHVLRLLDKPEPMTEAIAKRAGEAIARVPGATTIDAIVMASAAAAATWSTRATSAISNGFASSTSGPFRAFSPSEQRHGSLDNLGTCACARSMGKGT